jgi:hypothetical protein
MPRPEKGRAPLSGAATGAGAEEVMELPKSAVLELDELDALSSEASRTGALDWAAAASGERARAETRAAKIGREGRLIYFLPSYGSS